MATPNKNENLKKKETTNKHKLSSVNLRKEVCLFPSYYVTSTSN